MAHPLKHAALRVLLVTLAAWFNPVQGAETSAAETLRDPMRPPVARIEASGAPGGPGSETDRPEAAPLNLSSILRGEGRAPRALIDGAWLTPGDTVGTWRVRRIGVDTVLLTALDGSGQEKRLALHAVSIRRSSP